MTGPPSVDRELAAKAAWVAGKCSPPWEHAAGAMKDTYLRSTDAVLAEMERQGFVLRKKDEITSEWGALEVMVRQFAIQTVKDGVTSLWTGGLSALEEAFAVLGWNDPHPCPEGACQHPGCDQWATCGTPTSEGYKRLCYEHYALAAEAGVLHNAPGASPAALRGADTD
jgi:hypothetical protein